MVGLKAGGNMSLLARFLPLWPDPAPFRRPERLPDEAFIETALTRLHRLSMATDEKDETRPWLVPLSNTARDRLDAFRHAVREWETEAEGLLLSFIGKLPGLSVRLSLILAYLDWLTGQDMEPLEIGAEIFERAAFFIERYALPMARRAYADASLSKSERAARRLLTIIQENAWERFTSREVLRLDRKGLTKASDLNPALTALTEADVIRPIADEPGPNGGRPAKLYAVNPAVLRAAP